MSEHDDHPMDSIGQRSMGRRAVLAGAFGGVIGLAVKALGVPDKAMGANGDPVLLGPNTDGHQ